MSQAKVVQPKGHKTGIPEGNFSGISSYLETLLLIHFVRSIRPTRPSSL